MLRAGARRLRSIWPAGCGGTRRCAGSGRRAPSPRRKARLRHADASVSPRRPAAGRATNRTARVGEALQRLHLGGRLRQRVYVENAAVAGTAKPRSRRARSLYRELQQDARAGCPAGLFDRPASSRRRLPRRAREHEPRGLATTASHGRLLHHARPLRASHSANERALRAAARHPYRDVARTSSSCFLYWPNLDRPSRRRHRRPWICGHAVDLRKRSRSLRRPLGAVHRAARLFGYPAGLRQRRRFGDRASRHTRRRAPELSSVSGYCTIPKTFPSASFTVAVKAPPPTSLTSCPAAAPASSSR